jgi:RNA polymerase sigma-70 factor (ECF subfamily)
VTDQSPSDGTLVAAILAGEREAFAPIVERYEGALLRLAKSRLGRRDWAEDAVQEAFLCAFKWLHTYDPRFSFRTWLWTILLNQCNRQHQRRARQAQLEGISSMGAAVACGCATPPETLLAKERTERLNAVLAELPTEQADALRLRFYGELKFQEIADVQRCSLTSAKNRVRWGLLKMAQRLGNEQIAAPQLADNGA